MRERERERDRQTDRQTDGRQTERKSKRESKREKDGKKRKARGVFNRTTGVYEIAAKNCSFKAAKSTS